MMRLKPQSTPFVNSVRNLATRAIIRFRRARVAYLSLSSIFCSRRRAVSSTVQPSTTFQMMGSSASSRVCYARRDLNWTILAMAACLLSLSVPKDTYSMSRIPLVCLSLVLLYLSHS